MRKHENVHLDGGRLEAHYYPGSSGAGIVTQKPSISLDLPTFYNQIEFLIPEKHHLLLLDNKRKGKPLPTNEDKTEIFLDGMEFVEGVADRIAIIGYSGSGTGGLVYHTKCLKGEIAGPHIPELIVSIAPAVEFDYQTLKGYFLDKDVSSFGSSLLALLIKARLDSAVHSIFLWNAGRKANGSGEKADYYRKLPAVTREDTKRFLRDLRKTDILGLYEDIGEPEASVPLVLLHGEQDTVVSPEHSSRLYDFLRSRNGSGDRLDLKFFHGSHNINPDGNKPCMELKGILGEYMREFGFE